MIVKYITPFRYHGKYNGNGMACCVADNILKLNSVSSNSSPYEVEVNSLGVGKIS